MPKIDDKPLKLKPYLFHSVSLNWGEGDQANGDCPYCGRAGKFSVSISSGLWRCFVCGTGSEKGGGNVLTFLRKLWEASLRYTDPQWGSRIVDLASDRRLLDVETLDKFGVRVSPLTGEILVPGYDIFGKLGQLYKYSAGIDGKRRLLAVPGLEHQVFGVFPISKKTPTIAVCEGPWDAMALWEVLNSTKLTNGQYALTSSIESSMASKISVIGVPGCNIFHERWAELVDKKDTWILFDSDSPKEVNGKKIDPAGYAGVRRIASLLSRTEGRPRTVSWLKWGENGYDPSLAPGYDVRDALKDGQEMPDRCRLLGELLSKIEPIPDDWTLGKKKASASRPGEVGIECEPCHSWKALTTSWMKALKWTEGLERALTVMLASVTSTMAVGDQLWVKIVGPPACGKSTLCEALSVNRKYIYAKSTLRGFHSGFDDGSGENHSPLASMKDKTLVIKDGDTLLKSPNLDQILSEARDVYDRVSRSSYRTKQSKDWEGLNITIILCGTGSLRVLDSSELGERFLTCIIMEEIDEDLEDEILWRKINQADRSMAFESAGDPESQHSPEMLNAMQLTGGYVAYLRQNARELLGQVEMSDASKRTIATLAKFVSYVRARPSTKQEESVEREMATRLGSQLTRLAKSAAVVMNKGSVDEKVMDTVRKVAVDTAKGRTLEIMKHLHSAGEDGLSSTTLAIYTAQTEESERKLLRFLRKIKSVEDFKHKDKVGVAKPRWRLTRAVSSLMSEVFSQGE